jgi:hypothetical protein
MMRRSQVENFRLPWLSLFALDPSGRPARWIPFSRRLAKAVVARFPLFPFIISFAADRACLAARCCLCRGFCLVSP